jgi:hypothetical protein
MPDIARRVVVLLLVVISLASLSARTSAQIFEMREYHGKPITCSRSGLIGWYKNCGTDHFYSQIFRGAIQSLTSIEVGEFDEFRLVLQPEEIFRGEVPQDFTVTTNEGLCLPPVHVGDRWLFYIFTDKERGPLLEYGHPGGPLPEVQQDLARLRGLVHMHGSGMVMGHLLFDSLGVDDEARRELAHRQVQLISKANGQVFRALSDQDTRFEFEPLPAGKYVLSVPHISGLWTGKDGEFEVEERSCKDFDIRFSPDGEISGHVHLADGTPAGSLRVYALSADGNGWSSETTDKRGFFQLHGVRPGRYLIGAGPDSSGSDGPDVSIYFPGVASREAAGIVELGQAEHRTGLDFVIPQVIPR